MEWVYQEVHGTTAQKIQSLSEQLNNAPYPLCEVLVKRGIDTYEKAKYFFKPELSDLHDPFLMKDMDKAVQRVQQAIERKEKILIYGDYDVDGTTAVSLFYWFFEPFYKDYIDFYIPDRNKEGYGISWQGIDYAEANNFSLVIALDCGITACDKVEYARSKGIDFIICDHHLPGNSIPNAVAVLDPKRNDCSYPYKELSGCGVGFKLCQALAMKMGIPMQKVYDLLDLVAISIASDLVDATGENRVMMHYGMKLIAEKPRSSIQALMQVSGLSGGKIDTYDIVFKLGPRINAAGRLEHAKYAVELLTCQKDISQELANYLNKLNQDRKNFEKKITEEAVSLISNNEVYSQRKSIVLCKEDWHKGVIGIAASKIVERYYRPTILLTESEGRLVGSARSVYEFDIYEAIAACRDLLLQYGGHKYAAGLALKKENLESFTHKFEEVVSATVKPDSLKPVLNIDATCQFSDFSNDGGRFIRILKRMAPFGPVNMAPVFKSERVSLYTNGGEGYRVVGEQHLQLTLTQDNQTAFAAIAFGMGTPEVLQKLKKHKYFNVAYHLEENEYNNQVTLQLRIKDLQWL
ncbi:MAG: single-stranded-DNA-specific exonuclease RecJ [Bacteroidia bacterium]|nr:single-stranded-DNA-specific exonuclease RecJ [Bacteroidia bacterium]